MQQPIFSPVFSIIIPTYNRPERLATCLGAIAQLDYPRVQFEVIVVDDGSQEPLEATVATVRDGLRSTGDHRLNLTLIRQANAGPAAARNTGAAQARGQFLVFTDDDCLPAPDWLSTLAVRFQAAPESLIGGQTLNALPDNLYSTASQILIDYLYDYYNAKSIQPNFFASNNFALATDRFRALGGFDTSFPLAAGEDREFCDRWLHHGYPMLYAPEVQIAHAHHLTFAKFWRQHFNYGRGAFCFHQVRAKRAQDRIRVEPWSFYFNLLTYPFRRATAQPPILLAGLLWLSQVANVGGFFWERSRQATQPATLSTKVPQ
jgi:glycosyltransferase involved in cell wall biosynthesis